MNNFNRDTLIYMEVPVISKFDLRGASALLFSLFCGSPKENNFGFIGSCKELKDFTNLSKNGIISALKKLEDKKLIRITKPEKLTDLEAFQRLNKKNSPTGCLFCGFNGFEPLDEHHYPIRKKDGGTKTITLCPNCHRHFHVLTGDTDPRMVIEVLKKDEIIKIRESYKNNEQGEKENGN